MYNPKEIENNINYLILLDIYLTNSIKDEEIYRNDWKVNGIPYNPTTEDFHRVAKDEELYRNAIDSANRCDKYIHH